jgi:DNA-binding transcriptional LysR family regulator
MLELRGLEVFREVVRCGSFSIAGAALGLTQPGVSRQISALERQCGHRLLNRSARGVALTTAGEVLLGHADAVVGRVTIAEHDLDRLAAGDDGSLRIGTHPSAAVHLVPTAVAAFRIEHPQVTLSLAEVDSTDAPRSVRTGEIDLAVISTTRADDLDWSDLTRHLICSDEWCLLLPSAHPLAAADRIRVDDLDGEIFIEGTSTRAPLAELFQRNGLEPSVRFRCDEWLGRQGLVAAGVGLTLVPRLAAPSLVEGVVLRTLTGAHTRRKVYAAVHEARGREPVIRSLITNLDRAAPHSSWTRPDIVSA